MPTYEYKCTKCGHTFEAIQSMKDKPLSRCPECKSAVRRVINGGIGVIFKGSGFYSTDNKKSSALTGGNGSSKDKERTRTSQPKSLPKSPRRQLRPTRPPRKKQPPPDPSFRLQIVDDLRRRQCLLQERLHVQVLE